MKGKVANWGYPIRGPPNHRDSNHQFTSTWNSEQPVFYGCFNWMIPNHDIRNGCFTKHPLNNGCLGYQGVDAVREQF